MIIFIYGTTAEAIKLAPIMTRLQERDIPFEQWVTFQHTDALRTAMDELGLPPADRIIANGWRGRPLKRPVQMLGWMFGVFGWSLRHLHALRRERRARREPTVVLVHGDTVTTVLGTVIGRLVGVPVGHVEAGLRSGHWRHPFPEEIDRRIVGRLASIHYAPGSDTAANLAGRANVIMTHGNTVKDAVRDKLPTQTDVPADQGGRYGLVLLHRFEFISQPSLVRSTLEALEDATTADLRVVVDSYSRAAIESTIAEIGAQRMTIMPKLEHGAFVALLRGADFVVTDSGGIQEESAVFGIPTLIHRMATERSEGLGTSALLSRWDTATVRRFVADPSPWRTVDDVTESLPSTIVVDDLVARGFAGV